MLINLPQSLRPKVILVEEAGQVLEAHSLATLVPSVEHFISIGDPQQLRPSINTYGEDWHIEQSYVVIDVLGQLSRRRILVEDSCTDLIGL